MRIMLDLQGAQSESRFRGIGRYSLSLAQAIARNAGEHEVWLVLNAAFPECIPSIRSTFSDLVPPERVAIFSVPLPIAERNSANDWRARAAERIREDFLRQINPDVVHVSSLFEGFVDDAVTSVGSLNAEFHTAVTLYDLIPWLNQDAYLAGREQRTHYLRKLDSLKRADILLAISDWSRREAIESLGLPENRVINISSAVDAKFRPIVLEAYQVHDLRNRFGIRRDIIMCAPGGFDARKNLDGLIRAYALLGPEIRSAYQLVIVSKANDGDRIGLQELRKRLGLGEDDVVVTGYVSDIDLIHLYNMATLFVLPSKHEGFGLPALEAMTCGIPALGSNTTSIPEVIGEPCALFDPHNPTDIAARISDALSNPNVIQALRETAARQAAKFSWDYSAKQVISAYESLGGRDRAKCTANWAGTLARNEQNYRDLICSVAGIDATVIPLESDLVAAAASIAKNLSATDYVARSGFLSSSPLTWRIEGPFDSSYSLALLNRETAIALDRLGHQVVLHSTEGPGDFLPSDDFLNRQPEIASLYRRSFDMPPEDCDVTSRNLYPPRVADMRCRINLLHHYAWEETGFPREWVDEFNEQLQGITCLSRHVEKLLIDHGVTVPLSVSGCGVDHWEHVKPAVGCDFGGRTFRFLHVSSCFPRKGVDLLLSAYALAFTDADDVSLIIKTFPNPHNDVRRQIERARHGRQDYPDVIVLEEDLSDSALKALYGHCDALVAPSRAEGFGLPLAEAMLSGLPVITTAWSGQLDFCNPDTAWLIDYSFEPAKTHFRLFDSAWAALDVNKLAQAMREVFSTPQADRAQRSLRGRKLLLESFKWADVAERLVSSARMFAASPPAPQPRIGWVTTWGTRCGIAIHSESLSAATSSDVTVLAARANDCRDNDYPRVIRCWNSGESDSLTDLSRAIELSGVNTLVVQFNYGFFNFKALGPFLTDQRDAGRVVILVMHSTVDPVHMPHKRLADLAGHLARCNRILVHSCNDLNRLQSLGLVNNVTLFPLGIINWAPALTHSQLQPTGTFTVASYGFFLPHKGLIELIEAIGLLRDKGLAIRLRMVNAIYPIAESAALVAEAKEKISFLGLSDIIEMRTEFLDDEQSLSLLASADLLVFPYQATGESASAAVRYGLATRRPVAVTPLAIFDDVDPAVFRLAGTSAAEIAKGIAKLRAELLDESAFVREKAAEAERWIEAHRHARLGQRLKGIAQALLRKMADPVCK